jgi:hypothetical protein
MDPWQQATATSTVWLSSTPVGRIFGRKRGPDPLMTAVVGLDAQLGWSVTFASYGVEPGEFWAASLTEAIDQAKRAVIDLYGRFPPVPDAEVQFAIYPWEYDAGPIYEVSLRGGQFVATDTTGESARVYRASSLEHLVAAMTPYANDDTMLRWAWPVPSPAVSTDVDEQTRRILGLN